MENLKSQRKSNKYFYKKLFLLTLIASCLFCNAQTNSVSSTEVNISIESEMTPPEWALLQRELLKTNAAACRAFFDKYFDQRGYLLAVERWGGNDGPDDAIENVADWPILHMLGASNDILHLYKKAWEGHLLHYT